MLPATKCVPKELLPVYDRPLIQLAIDEARASGIRKLVLVSHSSKGAIKEYLERDDALHAHLEASGKSELGRRLEALDPTDDMEVVFTDQHEPLGLGHAILCAREIVAADGPVAVILPDDVILGTHPAIGEMARAYEEEGAAAHMVATQLVPRADVSKYGICDCAHPEPGRKTEVHGLVEKPTPEEAPSEVAIIGRYILGQEIFEALADTTAGSGGEIQLTDAIARGIDGPGVSAFRITGERHDCGHADGLLGAALAFSEIQRRAQRAAAGQRPSRRPVEPNSDRGGERAEPGPADERAIVATCPDRYGSPDQRTDTSRAFDALSERVSAG